MTTPTAMGPPPPRTLMGPPPPLDKTNPAPSEDTPDNAPSASLSDATTTTAPTNTTAEEPRQAEKSCSKRPAVPYAVPEWSGPPCHKYYLEVLKDGSIVDQLHVCEKGAYMFGRVDLCDFILEHPTVSRFHAVLQFKRNGDAYLYDTGSTHGTFINKKQVDKRVHEELHVGDVIRFGQSSRLYIFQGPPDLMPPETDLRMIREAKVQQEMLDREASLQRAKAEASLADGISWGMGEDAIEEVEDDSDEITWQTYKGQLTEKQEKTREKILKRTEKIAHMKKEIDAIRAKDIAQGGLTQGQQTQIARNELRITQIVEELENLEETLNESIRESLGLRAGGLSGGKGRGMIEDDNEFFSDDDDFYDRTKKPSRQKVGENQTIETADTLLDKRDAVMKEMEGKRGLLLLEKEKIASEIETEAESRDALDDFMSGVSSQLVHDVTTRLEKELSTLQSELDRISFLLKIADPSGEAAKTRDLRAQEVKPDNAKAHTTASKKQPLPEPKKLTNVSKQEERAINAEPSDKQEVEKIVSDIMKGKRPVYTVVKPQWLGAVDDNIVTENQQEEISNTDESDQFVDYKDRQKVLSNVDSGKVKGGSDIESAAPGLIMRKRKENEGPPAIDQEAPEQLKSSSIGTDLMVEDAVALLLKHKRGYHADDEEGSSENQEIAGLKEPSANNKKPKRMLGPEKPSFLNNHSDSDYEQWLPPEGQSGDGRTSLNEQYGY